MLRSDRVTMFAAAAALLAESASAAEPVDLELVLAVDVSLSMSPTELDIQRDGYAAALTHDRVLQAIAEGAHGKIAVTYFEWAGTTSHRVVVPWTIIANRADAERVAAKLSAQPANSARRTSIAAALGFGADLFAESQYRGTKRVIDISGDGPNNQGDLDRYYTDCVIGGPGAFMIPVNDWSQFPEAIRRKLVLELAGPGSPARRAEEAEHPPVVKAQAAATTDCFVGEKMWRDRSWMWDQQ